MKVYYTGGNLVDHGDTIRINGKVHELTPECALSRMFFRVKSVSGHHRFYDSPETYFAHVHPPPVNDGEDEEHYAEELDKWIEARRSFYAEHADFNQIRATALAQIGITV